MSKYKGLFTFDVENHRYLPVEQADGLITEMDYHPEPEPTEPLIKDEKIRKAVRAWAEVNGIDKVEFCVDVHKNWWLSYNYDVEIQFNNNLPKDLADEKRYTITELCGEEKE